MTDPNSVPHGLATIILSTIVPVQAIILKRRRAYPMFDDLKRRHHWVLRPFRYKSKELLLAQLTYQYDSYLTGNITATKEWGYYYAGSGQATFPTTPDRETDVTYLSTGTNNINRPLSVTLYDHGTLLSQTLNTYDSYASSCPGGGLKALTGVLNHDDTNVGGSYTTRGNLTKTQVLNGSTYVTTQLCHDTTGRVTQETDPNGNVTTYAYTAKFYSDNGTDSLTSYSPAKPTNAYATSITRPLIGATTIGYYYGSGKQAFYTSPNGVSEYAHFIDPFDPFDRSTEDDYPLCGAQACTGIAEGSDKTVYTSATETDIYLAVGEHKEVVGDNWGRKITETIPNYPGGIPTETQRTTRTVASTR
jgi:hypothetical protein